MPRNVTVTLQDGSSHVYQNVPDDVTPDAVTARASQEFGQGVTHLDGGRGAAPQAQAAPTGAPRWDFLGDTGRAAVDSGTALVNDVSNAVSNPLTMDLGPLASIKRMGSALKVPFDAAGVALSPLTGAIHSLGGSALSYVLPTPSQDIETAGQTFYSDPKKAADQVIDSSLFGLTPRDPAALAAAGPARAAARQERTATKLTNKAVDRVRGRVEADQLNPQDIVAQQQAALANGDQLTLMDLGGKNVRGLAGAVYRAPGPAGAAIDTALDARNTASTGALTSDMRGGLGGGSSYRSTQDLFNARSAASEEPYRAALQADSVAPFETQYRQAVIDANTRKAQIGKEIAKIEREQPGALAARGAAGKATRDRYMQLREDMEGAEAERLAWDAKWKQAQADKTSGAPGAVWSPRLQQFLADPDVQAGLREGVRLEKKDAISEKRPYKDSDFSIVGMDERGEPILGQVPTMKSLAVAKEGLDAKIAELVDPVTRRPTKAGRTLKKFRDEFLKEIDRLNPRYAAARSAWSGPSQTIEAIEEGKVHFTRRESNEQVLDEFNQLSEADKDFYRSAAAESKIDELERAPDASDKSKRIINNERDRKRFRMLFKSDAEADNFINSVARKRAQFDTRQAIKGGSQTAGRLADDANENVPLMLDAAAGLGHVASNNWLSAAGTLYRLKRDLGLRNNPALNSEIARIMLNPDLGAAGLNRLPLPKVPRPFLLPLTADSISASQGSKK